MNKYFYCGVRVKNFNTTYSYLSDIGELESGTYVEVPFGNDNELKFGIVDSCVEYSENNVPFPIERMKHIVRIVHEEEYDDDALYSCFDEDINLDLEEVENYIHLQDYESMLEWAIEHNDSTDEEILNKVIECYKLCVEQNIPLAALNLGTFYYNGRGVEQDFIKAFELYKIAADFGELRAICNCGYCFYYGRHSAVDYKKALEYFTLGALLYNDANCLYKLGDIYLNGKGVEKNINYAFILYDRALDIAEYNNDDDCLADAQFRVGKCLLDGIGVSRDAESALELLSKALVGFYKRRQTDPFVKKLIVSTKEYIAKADELLSEELR